MPGGHNNNGENEAIKDWLESLDDFMDQSEPHEVAHLFSALHERASLAGIGFPTTTPYINTIAKAAEAPFPGDLELEWRIRSLIRWNAMAMVVRANRLSEGIGGHISTYASAATLYEIGFQHFFRGAGAGLDRDFVYIQGHASPGIYARAFLEGRLTKDHLEHFRREVGGGGLSSYPHPWLMPDFWEFPTVSMGLGPLMAIYHARFLRYLEDRGLRKKNNGKVWAFLGDGETDEPESLGALSIAARENLDNLIFVINCNLQRLDGPVRGNGKIIQELESVFRGAGWNVLKVIWGSDWDHLLAQDEQGLLVKRMGTALDGEYQKYSVEPGAYTREHFFGKVPELKKMVENLTDAQIRRLRRGGHDPLKVYSAYKSAVEHQGGPTVILAKTIKGYGLGESGEGRNISHQQKKLNEVELRTFRTRFGIPISDEDIAKAPFYRPSETSPEMIYLQARRKALGGYLPKRATQKKSFLDKINPELFTEFYAGTDGRSVSTTMAFVKLLRGLLKDKKIGASIVPIVADEARTFGMEGLFRQFGIYSHLGQLYDPVDSSSLLYYKEAKDGQILEEGITEAGAMASFISAGTSYATVGLPMIPFFIFYSMFGPQRIGDLLWAAGDMRTKGFLLGATSGRTTLAGEGLQHQDGQSHLLTLPLPNLLCYDPAYAYELAVIIEAGIRRMYIDNVDEFYYLTLGNDNYPQAVMPKNSREGILKGMYLFQASQLNTKVRAQLFGSGAILNEVVKAADILSADFQIACDIWSVTSYKELYKNGIDIDRSNRAQPTRPELAYVTQCLAGSGDVFIFVSDYVRALMQIIFPWVPGPALALGTDGFGRSDSRAALRSHFEMDYRYIIYSTLAKLVQLGKVKQKLVDDCIKQFQIDKDKINPFSS